jgi:hypothetical protein
MVDKSVPPHLRLKMFVRDVLYRRLPNVPAVNYALEQRHFRRGNHRLPRRADDPQASLNDIVFQRMIRNDWTVLQQTCVDKEYAKQIALAKAPGLKVARTEAVMQLNDATTLADVAAWLQQFRGRKLVVKPTHSCAAILRLDQPISDADLAEFFRYSRKNFFHVRRETQYRNLERKLIVEENIAPATGLNDYKFSCANGHVLNGRVDVGRFTAKHQRAMFTVPDFKILPIEYGGLKIPETIERPQHLLEMVEFAAQLSRGFDFVRIDLYDREDGVYFGEFTFTPCAGASGYSDESYAIGLARQLRSLSAGTASSTVQGSGGTVIDAGLHPLGSP